MKTIKIQFLLSLVVIAIALIWTSCEKNDKSVFKVNEFKVEPQSDTAPTDVFVITEKTANGSNSYRYIHYGAYSIDGVAKDSTERYSMSSQEFTMKDTLTLSYLYEGTYEVILEAGGKKYSESFTLFSPK